MSSNATLPQYHPETQRQRGYDDCGVGYSVNGNLRHKFEGEKHDAKLWGHEVTATVYKSVRLTSDLKHLAIKKRYELPVTATADDVHPVRRNRLNRFVAQTDLSLLEWTGSLPVGANREKGFLSTTYKIKPLEAATVETRRALGHPHPTMTTAEYVQHLNSSLPVRSDLPILLSTTE